MVDLKGLAQLAPTGQGMGSRGSQAGFAGISRLHGGGLPSGALPTGRAAGAGVGDEGSGLETPLCRRVMRDQDRKQPELT